MVFFDAATEVLRAARQPLTAKEIVQLATERGLLQPRGKTPEASMSAELYRSVADPSCPIERVAEQGVIRARRGSVRWALKDRRQSGRLRGG